MSVDDVCNFLEDKLPNFNKEVVEAFKKNKIDGTAFIELNDEYLRELCGVLGDRIKIKKLVQRSVEPISLQSSPICTPTISSRPSTPASFEASTSTITSSDTPTTLVWS